MADSFHLIVSYPDRDPVAHKIEGESVRLGRSPDNEIQVLIREISTSHCKFQKADQGYEIVDLESTNGTKVNGTKVAAGERTALQDGDEVFLGQTITTYFAVLPEGTEVDAKAIVAKSGEKEDAGPVVAPLSPPSAKRVGVPAKKALPPGPATPPLQVTPADSSNAGSTTVKLAKTPLPPVSPPGAQPPAPAVPAPGAPVVPAVPAPGAAPPAPAVPAPPAPGGAPAPEPIKLAAPGLPPVKKVAPPVKKVGQVAPPPPAKKLTPPPPKSED